jgi:hypothetical protein
VTATHAKRNIAAIDRFGVVYGSLLQIARGGGIALKINAAYICRRIREPGRS